ncbi:hypothetical protein PHMEG_00038432, partial [Phytophthora megakarya]
MRPISVLCLASFVEHAQYLRYTLPETHPIFASAIFREEAQMDLLRCKLADEVPSPISPTGIPLKEAQRAIERMPSVLMGSFSKFLDDKMCWIWGYEEGGTTTPPDTPAGSFIYWKIARSTGYQSLLSFLTWTLSVSGVSGGLATKRWDILRLKDCSRQILSREIIKSGIRSRQILSNIFVTLWSQLQ